jgi:uracil-DNA glycosylase family 4
MPPVLKNKKVIAAPSTVRPLVPAGSGCSESGCLYCPLAPFHSDFATYAIQYQRNAELIQSRVKEPHVIKNRNITEEWNPVDVLFIGDVAQGDEDRKGGPFAGHAGSVLRTMLADYVDADMKKFGFTYLVRCRTPLNRNVNKTDIKSCSPDLIREIVARKPKLLVAMGNASLKFLTGQSGIVNMSGKYLQTNISAVESLDVLACVNPGYVLYMDHMIEHFTDNLLKIKSYLVDGYTRRAGAGDVFVLDTIEEARTLFSTLEDKEFVAFDTETGSLRVFQDKWPKLLCFSFAYEEGTSYVLPWDHRESKWRTGSERAEIRALLKGFFQSTKIKRVAQNEKFDRQHIKESLKIDLGLTDYDTMFMHLVQNERRGTHGLKDLAYSATGMGGYEQELEHYIQTHADADPDRGGSYANIPASLLFRYAGYDADCTIRVFNWLRSNPEYTNNRKLKSIAEIYMPQLSAALADMETAGAQINQEVVKKLDIKYRSDMAKAESKVLQDAEVSRYVNARKRQEPKFEFNPGSKQQLESVFFDGYKLRPTELTDKGFDVLVARHKRLNDESDTKIRFTEIVQRAITDGEWGLFKIDAETLHAFDRQKNPLAKIILEYRSAHTLHSTFVEPLAGLCDSEGKIHGSFSPTGTETGRLSSQNPNLQNIPNQGGGLIKQAYVSRFGAHGLLLNVDFSQIELRVAAAWFKEPKMREAYLKQEDLHILTAVIISGLTAEQYKKLPKDDKKEWRTRAKRVNFLSLYGGGPPGLQSTLRKDGVFVEVDECQKFLDKFFEGYEKLREGMDDLEKFVMDHGYLESFTGRRRRVPEVFSTDNAIRSRAIRQCVNFPIQGSAADMTLMALIIIWRELKKRQLRSKLILTVHDSNVADSHVDEFLEVATLMKSTMESLPELSDSVLPGLDWSWLDVPILAECEVGMNWGQMVEFDPHTIIAGVQDTTPMFGTDDKGRTIVVRKPSTIDELWEIFAWKAESSL